VDVNGPLPEMTDAHRTCIYRVVQEALTNCARHATPKHVVVSLRREDEHIVVVVQDDGVGFDPALLGRGGLGMLGMQERVQELNGRLRILSQPNQGTTIHVDIPAGAPA
jgi:signal transduction histidine kinase